MIHTDRSPSALPTTWKFRPLVLSLLLLILLYPYVEARVFFLKALVALVFSTGQILTHFKMDICERLSHRMHHSTAMTTSS